MTTGIAILIGLSLVVLWIAVFIVRHLIGFAIGLYYGATLSDFDMELKLFEWRYSPPNPSNFQIAASWTVILWGGAYLLGYLPL